MTFDPKVTSDTALESPRRILSDKDAFETLSFTKSHLQVIFHIIEQSMRLQEVRFQLKSFSQLFDSKMCDFANQKIFCK